MTRSRFHARRLVPPACIHALGLLLALTAGGCGHPQPISLGPNERPRLEITSAPVPGAQLGNYSWELSWAGYDRDGRIDRFEYAIDAPAVEGRDTLWVRTTVNRQRFTFAADSLSGGQAPVGGRYHTVVLRAVDDRGDYSAPVSVSFNARTVAPSVVITSPAASKFISATVPPSTRVAWVGVDLDGVNTKSPVYYRWSLFGPSSDPAQLNITLDPDTLERRFGPAFASWDSLPGSEPGITLRDLTPLSTYLLAVVAFDEAGAHSSPFALETNILRMRVVPAAQGGPILRIRCDYFDFAYPAGGFYSDPRDYIHAQVPAGHGFSVQWQGTPSPGAFVSGYRWALDLGTLDDETARSDEDADFRHWSRWGLDTQARLPALSAAQDGSVHHFYLQARDNAGAVSLLVVEFTLVTASLERPLLVIQDTRLLHETRLANGCVSAPRGVWPTATELDTFLFARGGVPWRCYPAGTSSTPGILAGYDADSIVTYGRGANSITLERLLHYRNIVWITQGGFQLSTAPDDLFPFLRQWEAKGVIDPLRVWIGAGGRLWLMGGGIATATQLDYEVPFSGPNVFASAIGELAPGRFMYNFPHWRSEITTDRVGRAVRSPRAVGGWPGAADYSLLPPELLEKQNGVDAAPPNRTNPSDFFRTNYVGEYLTKPNDIVELDPTDPAFQRTISTLDTLYETQGGTAGSGWPVMTVYHGSDTAPVVFSGFPVWYFTREHAIAVTDFVLQRIWGLTRRAVAR